VNGKQFVIATLLAMALLTIAFTPLSSQQSVKEYDPWVDYNEDGKIDIRDIATAAIKFGTEGDPTKNVTIVKHATKLIKVAEQVELLPEIVWTSGFIPTDGYSKVTVLIKMSVTSNAYTLFAYDGSEDWTMDHVDNFSLHLVRTYDVPNQYVAINVMNNAAWTTYMSCSVYLMA